MHPRPPLHQARKSFAESLAIAFVVTAFAGALGALVFFTMLSMAGCADPLIHCSTQVR